MYNFRKALIPAVAALSIMCAGAIAQILTLPNNVTFLGHAASAGSPPVLTSCGTTPAIAGTDRAGTVTMGTTATGCVITFSTAYVLAPVCLVVWIATPLASQSYVTSASAITLTQTSASNNVVKYFCDGQSGG